MNTVTPSRPDHRPTSGEPGLLRQVFDKVVVEQVRAGRLRSKGLPPGVQPLVTITLVLYGVLAAVVITGGWVRRLFAVDSSAFGLPAELVGPAIAMTTVLVAILITAGMHAPWLLRAAGILSALLLWIAVWAATDPLTCVAAAIGLLVIIGFQVLRRSQAFVWWEYAVNLAVVGAVTVTSVVIALRPALLAGQTDPSLLITSVVLATVVFAIPFTISSGAAVTELAFSTSTWLVELFGRRYSRRTQLWLIVAVAVISWSVVLWRFSRSPLPLLPLTLNLLVTAVALACTAALWLAMDRYFDDRSRVAGLRVDNDTDVADLAASFRPLAIYVGIALSLPVSLNVIWSAMERGIAQLLAQAGVAVTPQDLATRLSRLAGLDDALSLTSDLLGAAIGTVAAVAAFRRGRRGAAELAAVIGFFCLLRFLSGLGMPFLDFDLNTLCAVMLIICTVVGLRWALQHRLTTNRLHALGVAMLLSAAVTGREILADPIGWLLGSTTGALIVFGLLWNLLTGADHANGDSPAFPRAGRTLAVVGYLTTAMLVAAFDSLAVTFAIDLDSFVELGAGVLGTALLLTGLWAVLDAGTRDAATVEARRFAPIGAPDPWLDHAATPSPGGGQAWSPGRGEQGSGITPGTRPDQPRNGPPPQWRP
ncbi:hypothetical protein [Naumannella halotolerans]|uniref:Uncharacterized protein n=1 Tax=Naumannella halotolerans TaxID=993414 RepID=A0A4R7JCU6_9ACTN|nr:hypothetical protein [Naumannella halotolerans]TDT34503.1 hypothetical protein CLV29_2173 [Naumannella halotolerans]